MASLQGLPPLPKSLRGLIQTGNPNWKEAEKMLGVKDRDDEAAINSDAPVKSEMVKEFNSKSSQTKKDTNKQTSKESSKLESSLAVLRNEMTDLRQLDFSLLCQLWTLSENIQEYKQAMHDKFSETNSTCSSHSLDNGIESLDAIEENEYEKYENESSPAPVRKPVEENTYENGQFHMRSINLSNHFDRIRTPEVKPTEITPVKDPSVPNEVYEPMYLEPVPSLYKEIVIPQKRPTPSPSSSSNSRRSFSPSPQKTTWTSYPYHHNTTYESSC